MDKSFHVRCSLARSGSETGSKYVVRLGQGDIQKADLIAFAPQFVARLFDCDSTLFPFRKLPHFLAYIMQRTRINTICLTTAFFYLNRLKRMQPRCKGSPGSGHCLFLVAIMIACKYLHDDTFDNSAWATVSCGLLTLEQINLMEKDVLGLLKFNLFIKHDEWHKFTQALHQDLRYEFQARRLSWYQSAIVKENQKDAKNIISNRQVRP